MLLRQLFESAKKTAVFAFGRMNPPTIGHKKLVDKIKSLPGDPYVFLSQTQKPKTDPLDFATKVKFAQQFFPGVTVGDQNVRTIIQALQKLDNMGYDNIIYVAGSDRVDSFEELLNKYNGVEYNFNSIKIVNAGSRDPDKDGAEGMSASKMREAAATGNLEAFTQGVPDPRLAEKMFTAVRNGMGVKDPVAAEEQDSANSYTQEAAYEGNVGIMELMSFFSKAKDNNPELVSKVKQLIKQKKDAEVWKIIQHYTNTKLKGVEFNESITNMLVQETDKIRADLKIASKSRLITHEIAALLLDARKRITELEMLCGKK